MNLNKKLQPVWRGLTAVSASLLSIACVTSAIAEANVSVVDDALGTNSTTVVTEETEGEDLYTFKSDYTTAKQFVDANKKFAEDVEANGAVLLKNNGVLPLKDAANKKVTLVGKAAYSNVLGGQMGSGAANNGAFSGYEQVTLSAALTGKSFQINPTMSEAYKVDKDKSGNAAYRSVSQIKGSFGMLHEEWAAKDENKFDINEVTLQELEAKSSGVTTSFGDYKTAIVVLGRVNSEGRDYLPGVEGVSKSTTTNAGAKDPLGLSDAERAMINMAKTQADRVIVIVNANSPMEIPEVANDEGVDAILWIGTPGSYGMKSVVDILDGTVNPSGKLPDTYAYDNSASPAAQNWGIFNYSNLDAIATTEADKITSTTNGEWTAVSADDLRASAYTIYQEGIYVGYKYYETRYFDSVMNDSFGAKSAKGAKDGASEWKYQEEVVYPFGYGLSYTTFEQTLKSVTVNKDKKTVTAVVDVKNTGNADGKDAVELYASVPYTDYDKTNLIEKSAIQLLDYEKVSVKKGETEEVTLVADLSDLASYDSKVAKTYILEEGDYYFSIGNGAHEAMNNILAANGKNVANGMDKAGNADNVKKWTHGSFDKNTFSTSANGTKITNQLDNADINYYIKDKVKYLTRQDWAGTYPELVRVEANEEMIKQLRNKLHEIQNNNRVNTKWGVDHGSENITLASLKGAEFDDPLWDVLLEQITLHEALHITAVGGNSTWVLESIQNPFAKQADGPNGYSSIALGAQITDDKSPLYTESQGDLKGYKLNTTPNAPVLAATFDKEILEEYGKQLGNMSLWTGGPSIWAGGANQHRSPYEGRTHEYFSEDPILSAYCLLNMTSKALDYGCLVGPKHFAFNAIEYNRYGLSEFMTEQTAREGELRCFQKAFESGRCLAVMTAFNRIGCSNLNGHEGLMQNILRGEWGFKGLATTDMVNGVDYFLPSEAILGGLTMMANGQGKDDNLKAQWWFCNEDNIKNDAKINARLQENMHYQWYAYANSNAMNGMNASSRIVNNMTWWRATLIAAEVIFAAGIVAGVGLYTFGLLSNRNKKEEEA